jgi:hypothetical protein
LPKPNLVDLKQNKNESEIADTFQHLFEAKCAGNIYLMLFNQRSMRSDSKE